MKWGPTFWYLCLVEAGQDNNVVLSIRMRGGGFNVTVRPKGGVT